MQIGANYTSNIKVSTSSRMSKSLSVRPSCDASISRSKNASLGFSEICHKIIKLN